MALLHWNEQKAERARRRTTLRHMGGLKTQPRDNLGFIVSVSPEDGSTTVKPDTKLAHKNALLAKLAANELDAAITANSRKRRKDTDVRASSK